MRIVAEAKPNIAAPIERDEAQVRAELATERTHLAEARREIDDLPGRRREMLARGGVACSA
jgi:hypothetical protein